MFFYKNKILCMKQIAHINVKYTERESRASEKTVLK